MLEVAETFISINGEGTHSGQLAYFVRFCGCNLNCSYCDTMWANKPNVPCSHLTAEEIYSQILESGIKNVTITGGEPLYRKGIYELLYMLSNNPGIYTEVETNGSIFLQPYMNLINRPAFTMDYKLPSSGMEGAMCVDNLMMLEKKDTVKFVAGSIGDLERAKEIIDKHCLCKRCNVYISPVFGKIEPADIVEYMKNNKMNNVTLQLQIHKYIWDPNAKGV